jgi:energy-coupling factor transporter ATP-binding protein EcfA2
LATHPLATISLMELLERRGRFSLHAACLAAENRRGVLLAGPSGSGKSTLALILAQAGMSFLSDDVVFLVPGRDAAEVHALGFPDAVGITDHSAGRLHERGARPILLADGFPKRLGRIEDIIGVSALDSCDPRALVFPEIALDRLSEIAPLDPGDALLRLVPDVLLTEPAATQAHLQAIGMLVEQARCYELRSGTDVERAAELVRAVI